MHIFNDAPTALEAETITKKQQGNAVDFGNVAGFCTHGGVHPGTGTGTGPGIEYSEERSLPFVVCKSVVQCRRR